MSDYEEFVYEKTNDEWNKSEIYYQIVVLLLLLPEKK